MGLCDLCDFVDFPIDSVGRTGLPMRCLGRAHMLCVVTSGVQMFALAVTTPQPDAAAYLVHAWGSSACMGSLQAIGRAAFGCPNHSLPSLPWSCLTPRPYTIFCHMTREDIRGLGLCIVLLETAININFVWRRAGVK